MLSYVRECPPSRVIAAECAEPLAWRALATRHENSYAPSSKSYCLFLSLVDGAAGGCRC